MRYVAAAVLVGSAIAHVASFVPSAHVSMDVVWPLHLATLAVAGFAAVTAGLTVRRLRPPSPRGLAARIGAQRAFQSRLWKTMSASLPRAARIFVMVILGYGIANFALFFIRMPAGGPEERSGRYFSVNHGHVIRELTADEYQFYGALEVRAFSGHWLIFNALAFVYFWYLRDRLPQLAGESRQE